MQLGAVTDIGMCRKINEDNYYASPESPFPYAIIADGMGGHKAGEIASMMVIDVVKNHLENKINENQNYVELGETIRRAFIKANSIIYKYSAEHYKIMGMGTTATLAMIYGDRIITAHVGDSRAYMIDKDGIKQITKDHSYVQELVSMGKITPEEAKHHPKKNFITRAMGAEETIKVDISINQYNGEKILLCTDGLTNFVTDEEIRNAMLQPGSLQKKAENLVQTANSRGGSDNITIVVLEKENQDEQ
jgi:serine/threonine protein phosphatase PrpC